MDKSQICTALLTAPLLSPCLLSYRILLFPCGGLGRLDVVGAHGVHLVCRRSDFSPDMVSLPVKVAE